MEEEYFLFQKVRNDLKKLIKEREELESLIEENEEFLLNFKKGTEFLAASIDQNSDCHLCLPGIFEYTLKKVEKPCSFSEKHLKIHLGHYEKKNDKKQFITYGTIYLDLKSLYKNPFFKKNNCLKETWFKKEED